MQLFNSTVLPISSHWRTSTRGPHREDVNSNGSPQLGSNCRQFLTWVITHSFLRATRLGSSRVTKSWFLKWDTAVEFFPNLSSTSTIPIYYIGQKILEVNTTSLIWGIIKSSGASLRSSLFSRSFTLFISSQIIQFNNAELLPVFF